MGYTNSKLVTYTNITKTQKNSPRNHAIDTITIHCVVGQWTAKQICDYFANTDRGVSCNYGVGKDGSIGLCVDEKDRSWCSSSGTNDHRAITIEVASDTTHPYAVTTAAYNALIELITDICKRNGIKKLIWSTDKNARVKHLSGVNMTCHRDFANKACPGDYLYNREGDIAQKVNAKLEAANNSASSAVLTEEDKGKADHSTVPYLIRVTADKLNVRSGPSTKHKINMVIKNHGVYTIVEERNGWGRLKSGAGWICLTYARKV